MFVSNGYNGMSLYNITNPGTVTRVKYFNSDETKDFIWAGDILYTMSFNFLILMDVTNPRDPREMSRIY